VVETGTGGTGASTSVMMRMTGRRETGGGLHPLGGQAAPVWRSIPTGTTGITGTTVGEVNVGREEW